ncbi:MAG: VOC family protein [Burkholderiaceae bacterium]
MKSQIDHLVVVANSLEQGVQWCEATLGITPSPGGEHKLFGTHNRLFKIATPANPYAYFEIIAINSEANYDQATGTMRWFDMDNAVLQAAVAKEPRLVHFVANTTDVQAARSALSALGIERGPALEASRHSRKGLLQWQITVREDGQRLFNGALPTLIQWGKPGDAEPLRLHPRNSLPRSGVSLQSIAVSHPDAAALQAAYAAIGLQDVATQEGPANIIATLRTPKGVVTLTSQGL